MLVSNCCASKPNLEENETIITLPGLDLVYFPSFPYPEEGTITPIIENGEVKKIEMPYWYWKMIINYVYKTEIGITALKTNLAE
ncbi:MAG: hypothetical protein J6S85_01660 [Methanobrevibacter sp.]|nr:hypothetical protein [Methanobrevibacter sp.]MBO7712241.1 hypothetical protein [Methanobrevibacter sp.]